MYFFNVQWFRITEAKVANKGVDCVILKFSRKTRTLSQTNQPKGQGQVQAPVVPPPIQPPARVAGKAENGPSAGSLRPAGAPDGAAARTIPGAATAASWG